MTFFSHGFSPWLLFFKMDNFTKEDKKYMKLAIELAEKARGKTMPNPMVGAVIVKNNKIIASGYHKKAGKPHAEIAAIKNCNTSLSKSKFYVTLEPCSTYGRTPPCVEELKKHNFSEIIIGTLDPNPKVNGNGVKILKDYGFKVKVGLLGKKIKKQNEAFFKNMEKSLPFITAKIASSIDGKIATKTGDSKWITSPYSRQLVQKFRKEAGAVLTGINTIISDNPHLYPREGLDDYSIDKKKDGFRRIILDSNLKIDINSNILKTSKFVETIIFTSGSNKKKEEYLRSKNIDIIKINPKNNLKEIIKLLYRDYNINSILLESGPTLLTSLLIENLIDKFIIFLAPIIIGRNSKYNMFSDLGVERIKDSNKLKFDEIKNIGKDIMITAYPK